ncbi:unnamed protein product [Closterium sp. NIES-65]|nr:unnamed protein product [Closterium sp. NIES-65]CAI6009132.1 unnamed protein product [Closterium sp. NIES-65]
MRPKGALISFTMKLRSLFVLAFLAAIVVASPSLATHKRRELQEGLLLAKKSQSLYRNKEVKGSGGGDGAGGAARGAADGAAPSLTIFCAPKPYESVLSPKDRAVDNQRRALLSWLRLTPAPKIVLLGNDTTFHALAREFPTRISVDDAIDTNFYGVPQFHSIVARAQAADTDLSMIINGDIILLNDVMVAIEKIHRSFPHWVMTSARWDVKEDFPYSFEPSMWASSGGGGGRSSAAIEKEIKKLVRETGSLHTYGGVDFWAWNNSPLPLFTGIMPPFMFGRGKYDNWLTHEMVASGVRQVVDASDAVTAIHVAHSYSHVVEGDATKEGKGLLGKTIAPHHARVLQPNFPLSLPPLSPLPLSPLPLTLCPPLPSATPPAVFNMCLQKRLRPATCTCEFSNFVENSQSDPKLDATGHKWQCGTVSVDKQEDYSIAAVPSPKTSIGLPHTMEQLLPRVAREENGLKVVTLVAVTFGYAEMLMSFVCRLRGLGLADNLVVAALDEDLYRFAFTQGLAVYYEQGAGLCSQFFAKSSISNCLNSTLPPFPRFLPFLSLLQVSVGLKGIDSKNCAFGSQCFRQFTKLKSRAVLRVLKAGYSVLWTDVDIVWFSDPLPDLMSYGPGTFPIQSNEPNASLPGTGIRRINSGFYFARSDARTIEGFEAITAHAATTKLSEQPSFYDILCGVKGENVVPGKEECVWKNGLRTIFLDRAIYPNGAVHGFWEAADVMGACRRKGSKILHNNWIAGKDAKKERFVVNSFWHYDGLRRMCTWDWHSKLPDVIVPEVKVIKATT